ncbi:ATP/GTP-binding protein [Streptomyces lavendulae subsp. lavendulae]|nr:ATP/GTP-binding protein [Streptomyces lavendulae subsp. lavendulae]
MLRRAAYLIAAAWVCLALAAPAPASASSGEPCDIAAGWVSVCVNSPGGNSTSSGGKPDRGNNDSSSTVGAGVPDWTDTEACAIRRLEPQPPASSPLWQGHGPGDGAIYVNPCLGAGPDGIKNMDIAGSAFWSQNAPAPAVDPAVLAQRAVDSMLLEGPAVVSPRAAGTYTVGVPVWMWVGQGQTTWGPNSASASAGGITVTATAKVSRVVWSMGDGSSVTCTGPGTPYAASRGMAESPDCGHRYKATSARSPGGKYQGTATSTWSIDWAVTGGGQTGQLTEVRQSAFTVAVGELQVVGQ